MQRNVGPHVRAGRRRHVADHGYKVTVVRQEPDGSTTTTTAATLVIAAPRHRVRRAASPCSSLAVVGLGAAWLAGVRVPIASGTTYMQIAKLGGADAARVARPARSSSCSIGSDLRPGVGGARGDALHLIGVNPATQHGHDARRPPRHVLARRQDQPRALAGRRRAAWPNALGELIGVPVTYAVSVDFAGFTSIVDGVGGVQVNVPMDMHDKYSGAHFARRTAAAQRRPGAAVLARPPRLPEQRHHPHEQPGRADPRGHGAAEGRSERARWASSRPRRCSAGTRSSTASASPTSTGSAGWPSSSTRPTIRNVTIPVGGGQCLSLVGDAGGLFADFADDATLQSH